jgi:hypothetical protein
MQRIELAVLIVAVLVLLVMLALRQLRHGSHDAAWLQVLAGAAVGLVAAFVVLVLSVDLVPDEIESSVGPWVVVAVTIVAVAGSAIRLARR